jgi:stage III sporulation protein AD
LSLYGVVGVGLLVATVCATLRESAKGFAPWVAVGGGVLLTAWAITRMSGVAEDFSAFLDDTALSPYTGVLLRAVGVGYIVKIAADICRDLGAGETATRIELCGKAELLLMAAPYVAELIGLAVTLVEGGV